MQVNVSSLKDNIDKLAVELNNYEDTQLNYYNELSNSNSYANSNKFRKFYTNVSKEKIAVDNFYNELMELKSIYDYVYLSYKDIGNNIDFNIDNTHNFYSTIRRIRYKISDTKRKIDYINIYSYPEVSNDIYEIRRKLNNMNNIVNSIENKYNRLINRISDIERTTRNRLNRLDFSTIQESDINKFI